MNTVYERFFQGYSVKLADTHGIVYTPQAIVDFMCASVAEVLEKEFGKIARRQGRATSSIPAPAPAISSSTCCGGFPRSDLPRVYREQLFANEVMLLPYYIAALNIEHAYYELTGEYEPFEGLCFVDTLDLAEEATDAGLHERGEHAARGAAEEERRSPSSSAIRRTTWGN